MGIKDWFRKNDTVIDLRDMQKRGILKIREPIPESSQDSVVDLTNNREDNTAGSALGFLGNLAGMGGGVSSSTQTETSSVGEPVASFGFDRKTKLRGILRDMKGKIDGSSDRIYKLSDRIDLLEKKIERLERRSGV